METKELTIEEQMEVLAETYVERVKYICENTIMSHRYKIGNCTHYGNNKYEWVWIEIKKNNNLFDEYEIKLIKDLKKELKNEKWDWWYNGKQDIIDINIKINKK